MIFFELIITFIILISVPVYKLLNPIQISIFIACSICLLCYSLTKPTIKNKSVVKVLSVVFLIIVSISYNLKAEKGWIRYIPFIQLLLIFFAAAFITLIYRLKKTYFMQEFNAKINHYLFLNFISICLLLIGTAGYRTYLTARRYYQQADIFLRFNQLDKTVQFFEKSINTKPNLYAVYPKLCKILFDKCQYDKVITICKRGLPYLHMTTDYYDMFCFYIGSSYFRKAEMDEALSYYDKLINMDSEEALGNKFSDWEESAFLKGLFYAKSKKWEDALNAYQKLPGKLSNNPIVEFKTAEACYFLGKSKDALCLFETLKQSGFVNKNLYFYLADLYTNEDMFDAAIIMYKKCALTDLERDYSKEAYLKSYTAIGKIYEKIGHPDKAEAAFKELLLFPEIELDGHRLLGDLYVNLNRFDDAAIEYGKFLVNKKSMPEGNFLIGELYNKKGDVEAAKDYYMRVIKVGYCDDGESYLRALKRMGEYYRFKGLFDTAMEYYKKIKAVRPAQMYFEIALAYINDKGMLDEALLICDEGAHDVKAVSEPYAFTGVYQYLVEKYKEKNENNKVIYISEKLLTYSPVFVYKWQQVGIDLISLYIADNRYEDALRVYKNMQNTTALGHDALDIINKLLAVKKSNNVSSEKIN